MQQYIWSPIDLQKYTSIYNCILLGTFTNGIQKPKASYFTWFSVYLNEFQIGCFVRERKCTKFPLLYFYLCLGSNSIRILLQNFPAFS